MNKTSVNREGLWDFGSSVLVVVCDVKTSGKMAAAELGHT